MSGVSGSCSAAGIVGRKRPISFSAHLPKSSLAGFDTAQLDRFEALLDCADVELFDWMAGRSLPPTEHDHDVMRLLRSFRYVPGPQRSSRQTGNSDAESSGSMHESR
jgi:hypothetical protein